MRAAVAAVVVALVLSACSVVDDVRGQVDEAASGIGELTSGLGEAFEGLGDVVSGAGEGLEAAQEAYENARDYVTSLTPEQQEAGQQALKDTAAAVAAVNAVTHAASNPIGLEREDLERLARNAEEKIATASGSVQAASAITEGAPGDVLDGLATALAEASNALADGIDTVNEHLD